LIVLGALVFVRQYLVGFVYFLELFRVAAFVRMVLVRQITIRFFDIVGARGFFNPQNFVIIFAHFLD